MRWSVKEWERGLVEFGDVPMLKMFQDIMGIVTVKVAVV
jgi:hypothetical protein